MIPPPWGFAPRTDTAPRRRAGGWLFLLAVSALSIFLAAETWLAGTVAIFANPEVGRRLLSLDADDPSLEDKLGQAYKDVNSAECLRHLRRATELSPSSRLYWSDLESTCEALGDAPCADRARERLLQICPMSPAYHWLVADSCLRANRIPRAFDELRRLLELDPTYAPSVWSSLQFLGQPEAVFQKVLADYPQAELKVGYVDFLSDQGENDAAFHIWRRVAADSASFPFSIAAPYLNRLIAQGRFGEAANVWQDLERLNIVETPTGLQGSGTAFNLASPANPASPERARTAELGRPAVPSNRTPGAASGPAPANLIFNGDFELAPLLAGFDWRTVPATYLAVDFSAPGAYHGGHCLRVDFTVSRNDEFEPAYQIVPVLPQHAYLLEGFVRSQDITSDSGPSLRVTDIQPGGFPDAVSETTVGTTPWHPVRVSFSTGPKTQAVRVSFWRPRSRAFPTEISGTAWLDSVSLRPGPSP